MLFAQIAERTSKVWLTWKQHSLNPLASATVFLTISIFGIPERVSAAGLLPL